MRWTARRWAALVALALLAACQTAGRRPAPPPLRSPEEGELFVYVRAHSGEASRLKLSFDSVALVREDGTSVPLPVVQGELSGPGQRMLAGGRVPAASYTAVSLGLGRARLAAEDREADLLVEPEPVRLEARIDVAGGKASIVQLELELSRSTENGYSFEPAFRVVRPQRLSAQPLGYCSSVGSDVLVVFDRRTREVVDAVATGRGPMGLALDALTGRVYVAASGVDRIDVVDAAGGEPLAPIRLQPADRPEDVKLTPDRRVLVTANAGSGTASFLDPERGLELARVVVGEEPARVLIDRQGLRAYVLSRRESRITVLDVANRSIVGAIATDAQPVRASLNAAGTRLYVVHAGTAYMNVYALPDLGMSGRVFVGLGATSVLVDAATDLVYVASSEEPRLQVVDPLSLNPVYQVDVGGPASELAIDDVENTLFALLPDQRGVAVVDLSSRRTIARIDVADAPHDLALSRERD